MTPGKAGILALWVFCSACILIDSTSSLVTMGRLIFWATAIAHVVEFGMFFSVFREAGGSMGNHFAKTLAFGLFHVREVRSQLRGERAS